jgi:metal-responsive CopG/Arc/MetJ family transcriptional regulator
MSKEKIAITMDRKDISELDILVARRVFHSRSQAIQEAVAEKLRRMKNTRLAEECTRLEPDYEREMAEEGFAGDVKEWPEY